MWGHTALPDRGRFVPRFSRPPVKLLGTRLKAKATTLEGGGCTAANQYLTWRVHKDEHLQPVGVHVTTYAIRYDGF